MRPIDVRNLIRFNTRMGMFICPSNRSNVVAFIHGYQYATANECRFTELLSAHIADRYRVKPDALGWPQQIARLAEQRSLDWMDAYLLVSSELLNSAIGANDEHIQTEF
jgi:hypothetical protein